LLEGTYKLIQYLSATHRHQQLLPGQAQQCPALPRPSQPDQPSLSQVGRFRQRAGTILIQPARAQTHRTSTPHHPNSRSTPGHWHQRRLAQHHRPDHQAPQPRQQARQVAADLFLLRQHPRPQALQERRQHHRQAWLPRRPARRRRRPRLRRQAFPAAEEGARCLQAPWRLRQEGRRPGELVESFAILLDDVAFMMC
jgi:hypothetical protein